MTRVSALFFGAVLSLVLLSGCVPGEDDHVDETRDPNFQRGRALVGSQDFTGAMQEFETALEVNPHSAAAHFELAWLCEEKTKDYAEAIYHYKKHLKLRPNSEYADKARDRIQVCRRELATAEYSPTATQRELDRLNAENLLLRQNVESLRSQLVAATLALQNRPAPTIPPTAPLTPTPNSQLQTRPPATNYVPTRTSAPPPETARSGQPESPSQPGRGTTNGPTTNVAMATAHSHVVKSGETLASIASEYHVKLNALLQANPGVNPKKLKPGQNLNLP